MGGQGRVRQQGLLCRASIDACRQATETKHSKPQSNRKAPTSKDEHAVSQLGGCRQVEINTAVEINTQGLECTVH